MPLYYHFFKERNRRTTAIPKYSTMSNTSVWDTSRPDNSPPDSETSAMWLYRIFVPLILLIGLPSNTLAFITARQPQIRHLPTCIYLAYLAVVDNGVLLLRGGRLLTISIFGEAYDDVLGCLTNVFMQLSAWLGLFHFLL